MTQMQHKPRGSNNERICFDELAHVNLPSEPKPSRVKLDPINNPAHREYIRKVTAPWARRDYREYVAGLIAQYDWLSDAEKAARLAAYYAVKGAENA